MYLIHQLISQQHKEVVAGLNKNMNNAGAYLGKNVSISMGDNSERKGYIKAIGGYFLEICGLDGTFDESLRGRTRIEYREIKSISILNIQA